MILNVGKLFYNLLVMKSSLFSKIIMILMQLYFMVGSSVVVFKLLAHRYLVYLQCERLNILASL